MNLQTGAFGDPHNIETLIMFWEMMAGQHYPGAAEVKEKLEMQREQQMVQMQAQQPAGPTAPESPLLPDTAVQDGAGSAMEMMGGMTNGGGM